MVTSDSVKRFFEQVYTVEETVASARRRHLNIMQGGTRRENSTDYCAFGNSCGMRRQGLINTVYRRAICDWCGG